MHKKKCKKVFTLFIQNFRMTKWLLTCTNITKFASYCLSDTLTSVQELSFSTIMVIAVAGTSITIIICLTVCLIVFCRGRKAQSELYLTFGLTPSSNLTHVWKADSNSAKVGANFVWTWFKKYCPDFRWKRQSIFQVKHNLAYILQFKFYAWNIKLKVVNS